MSKEQEKKSENYTIDYENLAIPEIHTGQAKAKPKPEQPREESISYDTLAIPEIHIRRQKH